MEVASVTGMLRNAHKLENKKAKNECSFALFDF